MEERKRTIFAVVIALVLVAALLYSFGLNLFSKTPQLELADPSKTDGQPTASSDLGAAAGITVDVNTETVQSVIASLSRYESYYRSLTVTYAWGDSENAQLDIQIWEDGGWTRTQTAMNSGIIEHAITSDGQMWLWYDNGSEEEMAVLEGPAGGTLSDRMQYIPSYEDVLQLEAAFITQADYLNYEGQPCIYVEAEHRTLGYLYRYWISVTSGLLIASETEKGGVVVYRMDSGEVMSPITAQSDTFALPDGTVLYGVN
jgi:hypothetical protein